MKLFKQSSIYKFIYLGVIAALLIINFSRKEIHNYDIEGLKVLETSFVEMPLIPKKIKSLNITHKGLTFNISYKKPISITSDDGITRRSHIINTEILEDSLKINLQNSVSINFRVDNYGERLTVSSSIPKVFPTLKKVSLPFTLDRNYSVERTDLSHRFFTEEDEFHLKLNDNYFIGENREYINLVAENDKVSTLTFSPLDTKQLPIAEQWYMKHRDTTLKPIEELKENYLGKIQAGIESKYDSIKYNPELKLWQNIPKRAEVTENSAIVYLAQAMDSPSYREKLGRITSTKNRYPKKFGFKSSPYLGNIIPLGREGLEDDLRKLKDIQSLVRNSDSTLFDKKIPEHFFDANQLNTSRLERLINVVDKETLTLEQLSKALYHLLMVLEAGTTNSKSSDSIKEITNIIISKIKWDKTGLYLVENLEPSSQLLNLETGLLLIKASQHETSEYSKPIGEALISTFINNSNDLGAVSTSYNMESERLSSSTIAPEDIFLILSDNPYIPHYYIDKGIKAWTISDSIAITKNLNDTSITISYPVKDSDKDNSHHIIISGITPYKQLYYRGQPWRADKDFEKWGVGYYYEQNTQLLYFMPNHNRSREKIVITYE